MQTVVEDIPAQTIHRFHEVPETSSATVKPMTIEKALSATLINVSASSWQSLPVVDPPFFCQSSSVQFWNRYLSHIGAEKALRYSLGLTQPKTMASDAQGKLYHLVPDILGVVNLARKGSDVQGNEVEQRRAWDLLCGLILDTTDLANSPKVTYQ